MPIRVRLAHPTMSSVARLEILFSIPPRDFRAAVTLRGPFSPLGPFGTPKAPFTNGSLPGTQHALGPFSCMGPKHQSERVRRKIVAKRLRAFFAHLLTRFSGGSGELLDRAEKRSTPHDQPAQGSTDQR